MQKTRWNQNWNFWKAGEEENRQTVILPHDAMLLEARDPEPGRFV